MHSSRPLRPRPRLPVWLALLALLSCSGDQELVERARLRIERGDLQTAEETLRGIEGTEAGVLRDRIEAARSHRAEVERAVQSFRDGAFDHDDAWARQGLAGLLQGERDPYLAELVEQAQSDLATARAERRRPPLRGDLDADESVADASRAERATGQPASPPHAREAGEAREAREAIGRAREAQQQRQWSSALAFATVAGAGASADEAASADARLLVASIASGARVEADALLARAKETERSLGVARAAAELAPELTRFPATREFDRLRLEARLLSERAARVAEAADPTNPVDPARAPAARGARPAPRQKPAPPAVDGLERAQSSAECAALAQAYAAAGELFAAQGAWLGASRRADDPAWRLECERSADECAARIALREELSDFAAVDAETARLLRLPPADTEDGGTAAAFGTLPLEDLATAVARARVSAKAELGWCVEAIVRGDASQREAALARLGTHVERGDLDFALASKLVAQAKGVVAEGGWAFRGGRWVAGASAARDAEEAARSELAARHAALVGEFRRATLVEREAVRGRVLAEGSPELLASALSARWRDDWEKLARNPNLRQFAQLADDRRDLDRAREKALALIFDEERYFYPYNPPECPPDKAATYAAVQREVDELVGAVRDVWQRPRRVKVGEALAPLLEDASWIRAEARAAGAKLDAVPAEFAFALLLPAAGELTLAQFAWDESERAALAESDRVDARNERLWADLARAKQADDVPGHDEQEQVRVTNAYRRMLGRRSLAWNPRIQAAAQGHSDHMANTGNFSHFEREPPERRTPNDRMQLAGYSKGASENISMGRGDPRSAHEGWTQSSGHHRNILMRDHREMASAIASSYWTQNFGLDTTFLTDL